MRVESGIESEIAWSGNPGLFVNRKMRTIKEFGEYVREIAGMNNVPGISYYRDNKFAINSEGQEHLRNLGYHPYVQAALSMYRAGITPPGYHEEESVFKNSRARRKAEKEKEIAAEILRVDKSQLPEVNSASGIIQGLIEIATQDIVYPTFNPYGLVPMGSVDKKKLIPLNESTNRGDLSGHDLLSTDALAHLVRDDLGDLHIGSVDSAELSNILSTLLNSRSERKRRKAEYIVGRYGGRLGFVIAEMINQNPPSISPSWQKKYADFWKEIHSVVLTGELMSGRFAQIAVQEARQMNSSRDLDIELHPYPSLATLIGGARSATITEDRRVSILDFGRESVQRAVATYDTFSIEELHLLPPSSFLEKVWDNDPRKILSLMTNVIEETLERTSPAVGSMVICIPTYIRDGHPISQHFGGDIFSRLGELPINLTDWLNRMTGVEGVKINLMQSDNAAARSIAGKKHTAVLSLGDRVDVAFVPSKKGLIPLSENFSISTSDME